MKILVTGDSGFIAAKLAIKLFELGYEVVGVDKKQTEVSFPYLHIIGDLSDWNFVQNLGSFDVIFHIAGHSAGDLSIKNYEEDLKDNVLSTAHIIKLANTTNCKQIIYASSMAVYGDQERYPVTEDMLPKPNVYYGANKLASEHYLKVANSKLLSTTSIRLFNIYGPGQDTTNLNQGMVSIFIGEFLKNPHLIMRGKPDRFRDFLYVDDAVDGFIQCIGNKRIAGETINFATGVKHEIGELVELIRKKLPFETTVEYGEPTYFDLNRMHGDITKAQKLLGFNPKISLEKGIDLTLDWVLKHSNN
jgi:UDP-glucose 4-epimerase